MNQNKNITHPLVSVVLCTYNDEKTISETIEGILHQTFDDFEFIIWNDGSTDRTEEIIKSFIDRRIRYYYHSNCGVGRAAQFACGKAKGKYIARIDGDDISMPNRLYEQVRFLETHPDYIVVSSSVEYIDESGRTLGRSFPATKNRALQRILKINDPVVHPACMFCRVAFEKSGGYIGVRQSLDHILFGRIRKYGKIKNLKSPLLKYRLRNGSLSHSISDTPYNTILCDYRNKIIEDMQVNERDIELYNDIFAESRRLLNNKTEMKQSSIYKMSIEERIYKLLGGGKIAEAITFFIKDFYCLLKYC